MRLAPIARSQPGTVEARFSATMYLSPSSVLSTSDAASCTSVLGKRTSKRSPLSSTSLKSIFLVCSTPSTFSFSAASTVAPRLADTCTAGCCGNAIGNA